MSAARTSPCPICKQPVSREAEAFPFCSKRCRLIDLGNWLGGKYVIPGDEPSSTDGSDPQKQ